MSIIKKNLDDDISGCIWEDWEGKSQCLGEKFHIQLKGFVSICLKYVFFSSCGRVSEITFSKTDIYLRDGSLKDLLIRKEKSGKTVEEARELKNWMPYVATSSLPLYSFHFLYLLGLPVGISVHLTVSMVCLFWDTDCWMLMWAFCYCVFLLITPMFNVSLFPNVLSSYLAYIISLVFIQLPSSRIPKKSHYNIF